MERTRAAPEDLGYVFDMKMRFVRGNAAYDVTVTFRGESVRQRLGLAKHDVMAHALDLAREHDHGPLGYALKTAAACSAAPSC